MASTPRQAVADLDRCSLFIALSIHAGLLVTRDDEWKPVFPFSSAMHMRRFSNLVNLASSTLNDYNLFYYYFSTFWNC